ncbi:esterase [Streptomyces rubellomurinus subsp. indigoferus]|nr:esterase [Streptomyces rubellomurinus subsp. indigoferus]
MSRRGRAVAAVVMAAATAMVTLGTAPGAVAAPVVVAAAADGVTADGVSARATAALPRPTGPYPVGTTAVHLTDRNRVDPWKPDRQRELMISIWYPAARPVTGADRAAYMVPAAAEHFDGDGNAGVMNYGFAPGRTDWAAVRTHARVDASASPGGRRPVVLYSPGLGDPRTWGTALVEDLASRGYVVVTVDHTWEASEVAFPNGELATSVLPGMLGPDLDVGALLRKSMATRVDDTRFVLDELEHLKHSRSLPTGLGAALDLDRIGMVGHSAGGFTALQAMHDDRRIAAAVDLDGQLHFPGRDGRTGTYLSGVAQDGLDRPFLLMGTRSDDSGSYHAQPGWDALWRHSTGWRADVTLDGSRHGSYTDAESLLPQLARQGAITPDQVRADTGDVDPGRAVLATRTYVASFLDRWLRGHDDHLLDGPSARFPEVVYER